MSCFLRKKCDMIGKRLLGVYAVLHLILGPDHKVNTEALLNRVLKKTSAGIGNQYILVPEQFSFETERTLCLKGGDEISRYAEVLSLSRLADRVECVYGGAAELWLDQGGRLLAAAQAVEQVRSRLKLFAPVCQKPEFLESFLSAVEEFGGYGVTTEILTKAASGFTGQFSQKIEELSLLYESYFAVCAQAKDPVLRLQNLYDVLIREDFAEGKDFYICLFSDFTALERQILEELIRKASSVTMALPEETVYGAPVFPSTDVLINTLITFCKHEEILFDKENVTFDNTVPADLYHLQSNIAQSGKMPYEGTHNNVSFRTFSTQEQECRHIASEIISLVGAGAKFRDIAVACSDLAAYEPSLTRVFDEAGIPHYAAGKDAVTAFGGAQMVLSALRAAAFSYERDAVIDWLKTGAASISDDQCDRLENYAILWNISGSSFFCEWAWHPDGVGEQWDDKSTEALRAINTWREKAMKPLAALRKKLQDAVNVGQMALAVFEFMTEIRLPERMQELADTLYDRQEYQKAQQFGQVYDILVTALEQISLVMADNSRNVEEFYRLYEKLLSQYSVGSVPATLDEVQIGEISAFRGKPVNHLMIVGAGEGSFPAYAQPNGIFTEDERKQLIFAGVPMAPLRADTMDRELGWIYHTIRSARSSVLVTCTGDAAYLHQKAAEPFGGVTPCEIDAILNQQEYASALLRMGQSADSEDAAETMESLRQGIAFEFGNLEAGRVAGLYGKDIRLSASKIDKFISCRFAYFLRYGLRAEERKTAKFDASAFGTFVHAVLEDTAKEVMKRGGFHDVDDDEMQQIATEIMDRYAQEVLQDLMENDSRFRYLFEKNRKEAMSVVRDMGDELRSSEFEPRAFELKFADNGDVPAIHAEGKNASCTVMGFVDRVDVYKHGDTSYVRVVDYKTGRKDFDYADIAIGEGMQMLIYLFALTQNGEAFFGEKLNPAGVLYHMARQSVLSETMRLSDDDAEKKHIKSKVRKGLISDNDVVIHAMENFEESPKYLPISIKKDTLSGDVATAEQMERLRRHVFKKLSDLADEIYSGVVAPNPIVRGPENSACTYCEYSGVCQKDFAIHGTRRIKKMTNSEFFAQLEREEGNHGKA